MKDSDDGCSEHPQDDCELICEDCLPFFECEYCGGMTEKRDQMHPYCLGEMQGEIKFQQQKDDRLTGDL